MSMLTQRLASVKQSTQNNMYSVDGAQFQEYALSMLDYKGSPAHSAIGGLVTAINNNQMSVETAKQQFVNLLQRSN